MFRKICVAVLKLFLRCIFRIDVQGLENIPQTDGAILAVNHLSNWDALIVGVFTPRVVIFMAKAELFKNKLFGGILKKLGAFPVKRGKGDIGAIKASLRILADNGLMIIFPEGTRNNETVSHAKQGVSLISSMSKKPVIPVYISGEYRFRNKITLRFGEAYSFHGKYEGKLTGAELQEEADIILGKIRSLKTEDMGGRH